MDFPIRSPERCNYFLRNYNRGTFEDRLTMSAKETSVLEPVGRESEGEDR